MGPPFQPRKQNLGCGIFDQTLSKTMLREALEGLREGRLGAGLHLVPVGCRESFEAVADKRLGYELN